MPEGEGSHEKVGGINKNWWYVVGAVVGIVGYLYYRNYKNNQNAAAITGATGSSLDTSGAGNATTSLLPTGSSSTISTLSDWMNSVQSWAVSTLGSDPATVQNALQNYSNGNCLTQTEYNIIDQALGALGSPPDAPYQGVILCPNTSGTTTPPPQPSTTSQTPATVGNGLLPTNPLALVFPNLAQAANGWFNIPDPATGGLLASIGVPYETIGNGQYFDPAYLQWISSPQQGSELTAQGFKSVKIGNGLYYNPQQQVGVKR